jgi:hypothetical protein
MKKIFLVLLIIILPMPAQPQCDLAIYNKSGIMQVLFFLRSELDTIDIKNQDIKNVLSFGREITAVIDTNIGRELLRNIKCLDTIDLLDGTLGENAKLFIRFCDKNFSEISFEFDPKDFSRGNYISNKAKSKFIVSESLKSKLSNISFVLQNRAQNRCK